MVDGDYLPVWSGLNCHGTSLSELQVHVLVDLLQRVPSLLDDKVPVDVRDDQETEDDAEDDTELCRLVHAVPACATC